MPRRRLAPLALALSALAVPAAARPAAGQSSTVIVAGVADAETGHALEGAQIRLPGLGRIARTDWSGEAKLLRVEAGKHRIEARFLGYAPATLDLPVSGDTVGAVFMLQKLSARLDTVRIGGTPVTPGLPSEFLRRRRQGVGRFLTDSVLAQQGNRELAFALPMHLPGLQAMPNAESPGKYVLMSRRGRGNFGSFAPCAVDIYLDGMLTTFDAYDMLRASDLAGVELYAMESAPPEYRRGSGSCHVLLLWSKY